MHTFKTKMPADVDFGDHGHQSSVYEPNVNKVDWCVPGN